MIHQWKRALIEGASGVFERGTDLGSKQWTEPMPPISPSFTADVDTAFAQQTLHVAKRQREPDE